MVGEISEEIGKSCAQIALNWLLRQEDVTAPIIGARRLDRLEDDLGAVGWRLTPEQIARLSETSAIEDVYTYHPVDAAGLASDDSGRLVLWNAMISTCA